VGPRIVWLGNWLTSPVVTHDDKLPSSRRGHGGGPGGTLFIERERHERDGEGREREPGRPRVFGHDNLHRNGTNTIFGIDMTYRSCGTGSCQV